MKHRFKVGDIVSFNYYDVKTYKGEVVNLHPTGELEGTLAVSFGNDFNGWSDGVNKNCWCCDEDDLTLVSRKDDESMEIKLIINKPAIIAIRGDKKGIAKCSPKDTWDEVEGIRLAVERLKEAEGEKWFPEDGGEYFYSNPLTGVVHCDSNYYPDKHILDSINKALGNIFKTEKEAEENASIIKNRFDMMIMFLEGYTKGDK